MNATDQYLLSQVNPMLTPGEQVLFASTMRKAPNIWLQALLLGAILGALLTTHYFVVLTNRRMILIATKPKAFGGLKTVNVGVEEWDVRSITQVKTGGFLQNKWMRFTFNNGTKRLLHIAPRLKTISGTKDFFDQVPQLLMSGQLGNQVALPGQAPPAQMAPPQQPAAQLPPAQGQPSYESQHQQAAQPYGAPPQNQQPPGGFGAPQQAQQPPQQAQYAPTQQMQMPPPHMQQQQPQYGGPPQQQMQQGPFAPGTQVVVTAPDGSRHLATVMQEQQGHYLCTGPAGQGWVPAQFVARA